MMNRSTTTATQDPNMRPSYTGPNTRPQRRPNFRSQIPVRVPFNPERQRAADARMRYTFNTPHNPAPYTSGPPPRIVAQSFAERQDVIANIEAAFTVYNDRVQADFRSFRSFCGALVTQEHDEKEQWRRMCAKFYQERDAAMAIINARRSASASPTEGAESAAAFALKRDREGSNGADQPRASPSFPSSEAQSRPIRSLPNSRSPSPSSPSFSPSQGQHPPSPFESNAPPNSASSDSAIPNIAHHAPPSRSAPPLMTCFGASTSSTPIPTGPTEEPVEPAVKRRRSCDSNISTSSSGTLVEIGNRIPQRPTNAPALPNDFSHVDIMYIPMNSALVCRACLLAKNKASPNQRPPPPEPKSFPTNASWDALREHCLRAHPEECVDVARLHPAEIFELRRRLHM